MTSSEEAKLMTFGLEQVNTNNNNKIHKNNKKISHFSGKNKAFQYNSDGRKSVFLQHKTLVPLLSKEAFLL